MQRGSDEGAARSGLAVASIAGVLYFSEGFPYGIVSEMLPIYLRDSGGSLAAVGSLSLVSLAWTLKFLWAPLVDRIGGYRDWIQWALVSIVVILSLLGITRSNDGAVFWTLVTLLAISSASQDIAADALTITITPDKLLGLVNSVRVTTFRIALILSGGVVALASLGSWSYAFLACAGVALSVLIATFFMPRGNERSAEAEKNVFGGVRRWLNRRHAGSLLALVLLYRLGDSALAPMIKTFWLDSGFSPAEVGAVTISGGMLLTVLGAWLGGWFIARKGLWAGLLWMGIAQMASNAGYAIVASTSATRFGLYSAAGIESLASGLGTAAFLAFLMAICDRRYAATEFALLSALFVITRSVSGAMSGVATEAMGYAPYFWLTVVLGIPGLLLLPSLSRVPELGRGDHSSSATTGA